MDDEIEDAVMRAREGGREAEGSFNQRAWGSAIGSSSGSPSSPVSTPTSNSDGGGGSWDSNDSPRQPRGVMARRRVTGGAGNVFGRSPPSRPPPPPSTSYPTSEGDGEDGEDSGEGEDGGSAESSASGGSGEF